MEAVKKFFKTLLLLLLIAAMGLGIWHFAAPVREQAAPYIEFAGVKHLFPRIPQFSYPLWTDMLWSQAGSSVSDLLNVDMCSRSAGLRNQILFHIFSVQSPRRTHISEHQTR